MKHIRLLVPAILALALPACAGGGLGNNPLFGGSPFGTQCQTGTSTQLANPQDGAFATNVTAITIVANGNNNYLYNSYQNWYLYAYNQNTGQQIQGGQLNLVSDTSGPHPYASDFYYSSQLPQALPPGGNWTVYLDEFNGSCAGAPVAGSFST
jgi:hypothetical protein